MVPPRGNRIGTRKFRVTESFLNSRGTQVLRKKASIETIEGDEGNTSDFFRTGEKDFSCGKK